MISQPKSTVIRAQFLDFDVEGSQNCNFDYVQIRDGPDVNSTIIGRYCGDPSHMPSPILSTLNYLWISFVTDGSVQNRGFKVVLKIYNQLQKLDHIIKCNDVMIFHRTVYLIFIAQLHNRREILWWVYYRQPRNNRKSQEPSKLPSWCYMYLGKYSIFKFFASNSFSIIGLNDVIQKINLLDFIIFCRL